MLENPPKYVLLIVISIAILMF